MKMGYDVIVIGAGPAGLAAACAAKENGAGDVLVIERDREAGGILNQCIHNGFGLQYFKEELTGPEYAARFIRKAQDLGVEIMTDTMVLSLKGHEVTACNTTDGLITLQGGAVVLAMGCREKTRGAIAIPGDRPAGIFTAGTAQRYMNVEGYMIGRRVVILGSGDIGLIMARRLTLEGAKVLACVEIMPYCNGLNRNIVQCLNDYDIPLLLSHTVTDVKGLHRVESVTVAEVDEKRVPLPGTEKIFDCDTLLLSVGLIPENELTRAAGIGMDPATKGARVYENMETDEPGVFCCGNVVQVHDLVDFVTLESEKAGKAAAAYAQGKRAGNDHPITVIPGEHVTYTLPQLIRASNVDSAVDISFRVDSVMEERKICVYDGEDLIAQYKRDYLAPGEMEHITLPRVLIDKCAGGSLRVAVEE